MWREVWEEVLGEVLRMWETVHGVSVEGVAKCEEVCWGVGKYGRKCGEGKVWEKVWGRCQVCRRYEKV